MPWFCTSRPKTVTTTSMNKKNKKKGKKNTTPTKPPTADAGGGRESGFAVVRQTQTPQAPDELPVGRGQVVELMYTNGEWNYVKDVEGKCGYVPRDFCLPVERLEQIQSVRTAGTTIPRPKPRQRRASTLRPPQEMAATSSDAPAQDAVSPPRAKRSSLSGSVRRSAACHHENNITATTSATAVGCVVDTGTLDSTTTVTSTTTASTTSTGQCCPTIFSFRGSTRVAPLVGGGGGGGGGGGDVSLMDDGDSIRMPRKLRKGSTATPTTPTGNDNKATPPAPRRSLHRALSYTEAVITADQRLHGLTAGIRPTYLPLRHLTLPHNHHQNQQGEEKEEEGEEEEAGGNHGPAHLHHKGTMEHNYETLESANSVTTPITVDLCPPGNVFHYEERKPQGIFMSEADYRPRLQGEVPLQRGEMVIVTDYGRGEWAWILTASNQEGAVPKSLLSRYLGDPMTMVRTDAAVSKANVSTGTQTELVVSSAVLRDSTLYADHTPSPAPLSSKAHHNSMSMRYSMAAVVGAQATAETSRRSSCWTPNDVATAASSACEARADWFKSTEQLCKDQGNCDQDDDDKGRESPCPLPSPKSTYLVPLPNGLGTTAAATTPGTGPGAVAVGDNFSTLERRFEGRCAANAVDFEPEYDTISCVSERRRVRQTPVLIALRDCDPPPSSKHTLVLKKGDVLHHHPQEHYPNGWMWVYHTSYKRYGYVPKSHVAYMYVVQKKPRKDESSKEESV